NQNMKLLKTLSIAAITALVLTRAAQVGSVINRPLDEIGVGEQVKLNGEQFVKVNNTGLLMMTSTSSCPHGKMIAGAWVACHYCDLAHGYFDYNNYTCACNSGWNYRTSDHACIACPHSFVMFLKHTLNIFSIIHDRGNVKKTFQKTPDRTEKV
ncbi:MAG: hypothetical protein IJI95_05030, partial [Clostridia bacterium]|nr:hypothetical protein [Clostridia bacterium]